MSTLADHMGRVTEAQRIEDANAALHDAMGRLLRKNEALEIEKANALARWEELLTKYRRAKARVKELEEKLKEKK